MLALDVSSSVNEVEDALQRQGLAAALRSPEVRAAALSGAPVALAAFEWSGSWRQNWILRWQMIDSHADIDRAAAIIAGSARGHRRYPTALGSALGFAEQGLRDAPQCDAQTIDVSGDGANNDGYGPQEAYRRYDLDGVTVNALVIGRDVRVRRWFYEEVIRGPGAFVEVANSFLDFEEAMRRKLERELRPPMFGSSP